MWSLFADSVIGMRQHRSENTRSEYLIGECFHGYKCNYGENVAKIEVWLTGLYMRAVCKVRGLTLLLRVGTMWRCGDGLFLEVPPLANDKLFIQRSTQFSKNCCRSFAASGTGGFDIGAPFSWLEKPRYRMRRDLDYLAVVLMGFIDLGERIHCHFSVAQRWRSTKVAPSSKKFFLKRP
jgi:hypothetical protein